MSRDDDSLDHFIFGQSLLRQLGDVVVAEDAGRRRLERAGADRGGDEDGGCSTRPAMTSRGPSPRRSTPRCPSPTTRSAACRRDAGARGAAKLRPGDLGLTPCIGNDAADDDKGNYETAHLLTLAHRSRVGHSGDETSDDLSYTLVRHPHCRHNPCAGNSSARSPEGPGPAIRNQPADAGLPPSVLSRRRRSQLERLAMAAAALAARARGARARAASLGRRASRRCSAIATACPTPSRRITRACWIGPTPVIRCAERW